MPNLPVEVECIVCYNTTEPTEGGLSDWHHCRTCSAMWCDGCMEKMYYEARDNDEYERELRCPQCRKSVAEMQAEARLERFVEGLGTDAKTASVLLAYENLLTEAVHLCEAQTDGMPYYSLPLGGQK